MKEFDMKSKDEKAAGPVQWQIDTAHTGAHFSVRHMMVSNVRGEFSKVTGTVNLDTGDIGRSTVEASIEAASIQTREPARDKHLRSADFLDVEHFPVISFKSRKIEGMAASGFVLTGDLTIHGVTREVVLDVEPLSEEIADAYGNFRIGTSATTKIDRRDFGLTWNAVLETGGVVVGTEIKITIEIELTRPAK
jgi:polyisoprenoid-binding protein YceI